MKRIFCIFLFLLISANLLGAKDIEFTLYKDFLQKLIDKIFPISLIEGDMGEGGASPFSYKVEIHNPVLYIYSNYIQVDAETSLSSAFGDKKFSTKCRLIPVFNQKSNNIELKVIEGKIDLLFNKNINLGTLDLAPYLSGIKIPLKTEDIKVKNKKIKSRFKNVVFQLFKDKVVVNSEIEVE